MLPIFLTVIQALMFFGGISLVKVDMVRIASIGIQLPGSQGKEDMPDNYLQVFDVSPSINSANLIVKEEVINPDSLVIDGLYHQGDYNATTWQNFIAQYQAGTYSDVDSDNSSDNPDDPYDVFDSLVDGAFNATGHYVLQGGKVQYVVDIKTSAYGDYILNNGLVEEVSKIAAVVDGWFQEEKTEVNFDYDLGNLIINNLSLVPLNLDRGVYNPNTDLSDVDAQQLGTKVYDNINYNGENISLLQYSLAILDEWSVSTETNMLIYSKFKFPQKNKNLAVKYQSSGIDFTVTNGTIPDDN